jgi:hypothetical protein
MPIVLGLDAAERVGQDARPHRRAQLLGSVGGHDHDRGGSVVDAGGVARRNGAVLAEGRPELGERLRRDVAPDVLVDLHLDRLLARRYLGWHDLLVEAARVDRRHRATMRLDRELVLGLTRDPV